MTKTTNIDVTAGMLVIGDEILSGRTRDENICEVAEVCVQGGIDLREVRIVADVEEDIVAAVNALRARYTYVFTSGGIGPTHDDITADAIAKAFQVDLPVNDEARAMIVKRFGDKALSVSGLRMARIPLGASLIPNSVTAAPGFCIENVFVMAGVPVIMRAMLADIAPTLKGGQVVLARTIKVGVGESTIAKGLEEVQSLYPEVKIGSYPSMGKKPVYTEVVLRSSVLELLDEATQKVQILVDDTHRDHGVTLN